MVRQKGFTGKHKVADRWEKDYYEVISQKPNGILVFVIKSLEKDKKGKNATQEHVVSFELPTT